MMWREVGNALLVELEFNDFVEAFAFITEVAELAEAEKYFLERS